MTEDRVGVLESWVDEINRSLGVEFGTEQPGKLFLEFETGRRVGVELQDGADMYTLYTPVGQLSQSGELVRLLTAMRLNLYQRGTAGGVIGLDEFAGTLIYSFSHSVEGGSADLLSHQLVSFAELADKIEAELERTMPADDFADEVDELADDLGLLSADEIDDFEDGEGLTGGDRPRSGMKV